mgnify:CR=1 FL=1
MLIFEPNLHWEVLYSAHIKLFVPFMILCSFVFVFSLYIILLAYVGWFDVILRKLDKVDGFGLIQSLLRSLLPSLCSWRVRGRRTSYALHSLAGQGQLPSQGHEKWASWWHEIGGGDNDSSFFWCIWLSFSRCWRGLTVTVSQTYYYHSCYIFILSLPFDIFIVLLLHLAWWLTRSDNS